jgi:divalent metal cation (Fe/Co/Zn/Cd) transporter
VVHVEPGRTSDSVNDRVLAAALAVPGVREIHNVRVVRAAGRTEVSLHLKVPGDASLDEAHALADEVEDAVHRSLPEVVHVTTHLEPLEGAVTAAHPPEADVAGTDREVRRLVRQLTGAEPVALRFMVTDGDLVAFLTLGLDGRRSLVSAHEIGGEVRALLRREVRELHDVFVHTEPGPPGETV